ncbi:MAG: hypothetical protein HW421_2460 [Ignavibacteria bacterium]|nr:hypothetical protein [Ignavibacteria bacterium]
MKFFKNNPKLLVYFIVLLIFIDFSSPFSGEFIKNPFNSVNLLNTIGTLIGSLLALLFKSYPELSQNMKEGMQKKVKLFFLDFVIPIMLIIPLTINSKVSFEILSHSIFAFAAFNFLYYWIIKIEKKPAKVDFQ